MATHPSILVWRTPWTEEPGGPQSIGSQRVGQDWAAKHALPRPSTQREASNKGESPALLQGAWKPTLWGCQPHPAGLCRCWLPAPKTSSLRRLAHPQFVSRMGMFIALLPDFAGLWCRREVWGSFAWFVSFAVVANGAVAQGWDGLRSVSWMGAEGWAALSSWVVALGLWGSLWMGGTCLYFVCAFTSVCVIDIHIYSLIHLAFLLRI